MEIGCWMSGISDSANAALIVEHSKARTERSATVAILTDHNPTLRQHDHIFAWDVIKIGDWSNPQKPVSF